VFVPFSHLLPNLIFACKVGANPRGALTGLHIEHWLLALPANLKLGAK